MTVILKVFDKNFERLQFFWSFWYTKITHMNIRYSLMLICVYFCTNLIQEKEAVICAREIAHITRNVISIKDSRTMEIGKEGDFYEK